MMNEHLKRAYTIGYQRALQEKRAFWPEVGLGTLGALAGSSIGLLAGRAAASSPKGAMGGILPPTMGQTEMSLRRSGALGGLLGGLAGAGIGAAAPKLLKAFRNWTARSPGL